MSESLEVHHHDPGGPGGGQAQPVFLYDLASPDCYLVAERLLEVLGVMPEWQPVRLDDLPGAGSLDAFRCASEEEVYRSEFERRAAAQGVAPIRWPPGWPTDTRLAMGVAAYAKQIGRGVAFALAAFRQAFAGGRDLSQPDSVVIAAAACEMHPGAVLKAAQLRSVERALAAAAADAARAGVTALPALRVGGRVFQGPAAPEDAVSALASGVLRG